MSGPQRRHGDRAVAAAVVHQDDGAAELRLGLHGLQLGEDRIDNLRGRLARMFVPIVGVDLAADDGEPVMLDAHHRRGFVVGVRFLVDIVGRAEIERLHAQLAFEQALGEIDLRGRAGAWRFR